MDTSANTDNRRKIKYKVAWLLSFSAQVLAIVMAAYFPARLIAENNPYVYPVLVVILLLVVISVYFKQKMYTFEPVKDEEEQK